MAAARDPRCRPGGGMAVMAQAAATALLVTTATLAFGLAAASTGLGWPVCPFADWRSCIVVSVGCLAAAAAALPGNVPTRLPLLLWTATATWPVDRSRVLAQRPYMPEKARRCPRPRVASRDPAHALVRGGLQFVVEGTEPAALATALTKQLEGVATQHRQDHRRLTTLARNGLVCAGVAWRSGRCWTTVRPGWPAGPWPRQRLP